jgi:hypothetical protein
MDTPQTRTEKKKDQKQKGHQDRLGSSKHVRAMEALRERKSGYGPAPGVNTNKK